MKVEARVERPGFILNGRKRSMDSIVIVPERIYKRFGPAGTAVLAFIRYRPDIEDVATSAEVTPKAMELANRLGVSLLKLKGSGKKGAIRIADVREYCSLNGIDYR